MGGCALCRAGGVGLAPEHFSYRLGVPALVWAHLAWKLLTVPSRSPEMPISLPDSRANADPSKGVQLGTFCLQGPPLEHLHPGEVAEAGVSTDPPFREENSISFEGPSPDFVQNWCWSQGHSSPHHLKWPLSLSHYQIKPVRNGWPAARVRRDNGSCRGTAEMKRVVHSLLTPRPCPAKRGLSSVTRKQSGQTSRPHGKRQRSALSKVPPAQPGSPGGPQVGAQSAHAAQGSPTGRHLVQQTCPSHRLCPESCPAAPSAQQPWEQC